MAGFGNERCQRAMLIRRNPVKKRKGNDKTSGRKQYGYFLTEARRKAYGQQ